MKSYWLALIIKRRVSLLLFLIAAIIIGLQCSVSVTFDGTFKSRLDVTTYVGGPLQTADSDHSPPEPAARHVYFLKTHKCASTTLQRIIMLHGLENNLTFALPANGGNQFWPRPYEPRLAEQSAAFPVFDILAVHTRHFSFTRSFMSNKTVHLAIVRDPAEQSQSAYDYYHMSSCLMNETFDDFVQLARNKSSIVAPRSSARYCPLTLLRNSQMYDFGMDVLERTSLTSVQTQIQVLDREFHLVLVAELFDESLILMSDLLNWPLKDLVYFKSNVRVATAPISKATREAVYNVSWADKLLYDHFRAKVEHLIRARSQYVQAKTDELTRLRNAWFKHCVQAIAIRDKLSSMSNNGGDNAELFVYELSNAGALNTSCVMKTMSENSIIALIRERWPAKKSKVYSKRRGASTSC